MSNTGFSSVTKHPIEIGDYFVATNEISRLYANITNWIRKRLPGAIIFGYPRMGKTRAINYIIRTIKLDYNNMDYPIYHVSCRTRKNPNETMFFEDLLLGIGHSHAMQGAKANIKRKRLINALTIVAEKNHTNKIIMFLDDAQNLFELEHKWLMDIYNELQMCNINLIIFFVGQKELVFQRSAFMEAGKFQIVGRFMTAEYEFKGLQDIDDIEECLAGYDEYAEYPAGSGCSYTKFYFREAFENGFRLAMLANHIWESFIELRRENNINQFLDIPMQYFVLFIEGLMIEFGQSDYDIQHIPKEELHRLIVESGYLEWEIHGRK